nr:GNAT family N-acetyltransferase [Flintibacter muris]
MRTALQRFPVDCCDSKEELEHKKDKIYILEIDGKLVGSLAIYDNEIDDLIVGKSYQRAGYGEALLQFAISHMRSNNISPIVLHVADWNQGAIKMYIKNGFAIVKTEET